MLKSLVLDEKFSEKNYKKKFGSQFFHVLGYCLDFLVSQ